MQSLSGYKNLLKIYESSNSDIYEAETDDGKKVIVKILQELHPNPYQIERFYSEFEIANQAQSAYVRKGISKDRQYGRNILILEFAEGKNLKNFFAEDKIDFSQFLKIAVSTADALFHIHKFNIIHKDFNSNNIIVGNDTVKIIDFGISTKISYKSHYLGNPEKLEGTIAYISPEQTGRMNRAVDYRTDLYSLGVSLYEVLSGKLPFYSEDLLELIHHHIASKAIPLSELLRNSERFSTEVPAVYLDIISKIIMKLIEKNAEDRYQSAFGLKNDLLSIHNYFTSNKYPEKFQLQKTDFSGRFQIPEKLYGREKESADLLAAYERISSSSKELMLVGGHSGVGKSALVHEVHKPNTASRGFFLEGKFDQYQKNIPYSAWIYAFKEFVNNLLTESEGSLQKWKDRILSAVGGNGKVLTDLIPNLELVIGVQPDILELGPVETVNRFNMVFLNFLKCLADRKHPLAVFIDDWQWADSASLELLKILMTDSDLKYFLIISAFRDNEVGVNHPFQITADHIRAKGIPVGLISLDNLSAESVSNLVEDSFRISVPELAELVHEKTKGNAFFVNQFLNSLYKNDFISFSYDDGFWKADVSEIKAQNITDNVVELLAAKAESLEKETLEILKFATCIGSSFGMNVISIISGKDEISLAKILEPALADGFILDQRNYSSVNERTFRFAHDRIQQAVYSIIPESERKKIHLKIGKLLFENSTEKERQDRLFDITNQLNAADDLISDESGKFQVFCLNLSSASKSKTSTAYTSALSYIRSGYKNYNEKYWDDHYDLTAEFFRVWVEAAYLNSDLDKSVEIINFALGKVKTAADKGELYNLLTVEYTLSAKYKEALDTGSEALRILGVDLPSSDYENALKAEMAKVISALSGRKIGALIDLPMMESKEKTVAMKLLNYMVPPAFITNQPLFLVIAAKMVNISLEFGNTGESSYGYAVYGIVLCQVIPDYKNGYEFGALAYELSLKLKNEVKKCLACEVLVGHLNHWRKPLKQSQDLTEIGFKAGVNSGEIQFAGYIYLYQAYNRYYEGVNLRQYNEEMEKFLEFTERTKNTHASDVILGSQLTVSLLSRIKTKSGDLDEAAHFQNAKTRQSNLFICPYYVMKSQIHFLFQEYEKGLEYAAMAEERSADVPGVISTAENKFYYALNIIGILKSEKKLDDSEFERLFTNLERNINSLKILAEISPENFLHKVIILDAEKAGLEGRNFEAMKLYEKAIESAWENGFVQNEAMASELAGMFYLKNGFDDIASLYLARARSGYIAWGAAAKLEKFDRDYSQYLKIQKVQQSVTSTSSNTFDTRFTSSVQLDTSSILKASRSISGEIVFEKLLKKMMEIISENAGAEKAVLLLPKKDKWHIEAESSINSGRIRILESVPLSEYEEIPASVIQYAVRTKENLVISNAARDPRFLNDSYIIKKEPYSIMCIPLIHQGGLKGIMYLENRLAAGAFSLERVQMLQMFAAQISISIENAQLYKSLEEKVEERTKDLKLAQDELVQSEKMAALGQLVAGVAHEINNPIGAILSSIESISGFFRSKFFSILETMKDMNSLEFEIFRKIILEFLEKTPDFLTSKEKRQLRKETAAYLESKGFADSYTLADYITDIRLEGRIEEIYPLIQSGNPDRLKKLYEIFSMLRGINNIQISASKTAKIVYALKSYSHQSHSGEKVRINIIDSIETVITLYQNYLKQGVELIREYSEGIPEILCHPDEMSQIWTNLLQNAVQAMKYKGTLKIKVLYESGWIKIVFIDSGAGISEEIQERIFQPFFTTKPPGEARQTH